MRNFFDRASAYCIGQNLEGKQAELKMAVIYKRIFKRTTKILAITVTRQILACQP